MKQGTTNHPKFKRLVRELKLPQYAVVGLLESVWMLAAQLADDGNLSRFSPEEIADYAGYDSDPIQLIEALILCRWLDRNEDGLVIHDWIEHCPHYLHERRKKRNQRSPRLPRVAANTVVTPQSSGTVPELSQNVPDLSRNVQDLSRNVPGHSDPTHSNPTQSSPTEPSQTQPSQEVVVVVVDDSFSFGSFLFGDIRIGANKLRNMLPKNHQEEFRDLVWQIAFVALKIEGPKLIDQFIRSADRNANRHFTDYVEGSIRKACVDRGFDWHKLKLDAPECPTHSPGLSRTG